MTDKNKEAFDKFVEAAENPEPDTDNPYLKAIEEQNRQPTEQEILEAEFGRKAKKGYHLVRSVMGPVVELQDGTPRCCDPSSELYWSM